MTADQRNARKALALTKRREREERHAEMIEAHREHARLEAIRVENERVLVELGVRVIGHVG